MKATIGIDVGKYGAIYLMDEQRKHNFTVMPLVGKEYDILSIHSFFEAMKDYELTTYVEKVNSFGMGRQSAFNFGYGVGLIEGIASIYSKKLIRVTPQVWQKVVCSGIAKKQKAKARSMQVMLEQYKGVLESFKAYNKKQIEGLIDAFLICMYGVKNV